ncbi:SPOR domain-containing protein [Pseudocolwellia sp. HL-MZ7]|uniref:SPOR domain-containing protein n=1 Tax=Pseudocolwellia sp. HL-MZ7 TaxID=3400627 RepID=UPI003CF6AD07
MSTIERTEMKPNLRESVTAISANARIDYILRFSKHAVLVIDDDPEVYTNVGNEFLGSLSQDNNAAFVSLSSKLNDIQIRCRIIEQLFGNTLFDPEQPLSVNVIKLAEAKNEAITIVISNVEYLSLQLSHELCQLAEIAKKLNKTINVLLLGKVQAGINLSGNKHLFENKISILLAANGQLISWNASILKNKKNKGRIQNTLITLAIVVLMCSLGFMFYSSGFNSNDILDDAESIQGKAANKNEYKKAFVQTNKIGDGNTLAEEQELKPAIATAKEVFQFLINEKTLVINESIDVAENTQKAIVEEGTDIVIQPESIGNTESEVVDTIGNKSKAEVRTFATLEETDIPEIKQSASKPKIEVLKIQKTLTESENIPLDISKNSEYYQSYIEGYVIQLASFAKLDGYKAFLNTHINNPFHGYAREVNGKFSYIVTTHVYKSIPQAKAAIKVLSPELRDRGPWIKSIQAVNNEINLYNQSR